MIISRDFLQLFGTYIVKDCLHTTYFSVINGNILMNMDVDCGDDRNYFSTEDWSAGCRHHNSYSVTLSLIKSL